MQDAAPTHEAPHRLLVARGRLLLQTEALERGVGPEPAGEGLPVGSAAPGVLVPDSAGHERSHADRLGHSLLLVFADPACGFSRDLLPALARLSGEPEPVVVAAGEAADRFRVPSTPAACIVDSSGLIASPLALGASAILLLGDAGGDMPLYGEILSGSAGVRRVRGALSPPKSRRFRSMQSPR